MVPIRWPLGQKWYAARLAITVTKIPIVIGMRSAEFCDVWGGADGGHGRRIAEVSVPPRR
jgi:hypothetical protein